MKQRFLSFFFIACACLMWAMPAWAVVNWADLGVTSLEVGQDYYIYNINQGKFLIEKALGGAEEAISFQQETSQYDGRYYLNYRKVTSTSLYYVTRPTNTWSTSKGIPFEYSQVDNNHPKQFYIKRYTNGDYYYFSANNATSLKETAANTPEENSKWAFITKATFEANKWFAVAAAVEDQGEYYIYNVGKGQFLKFQSTTDKLGEAIPFTSIAYNGKYYLKCFDSSSNKYYCIKTNSFPWYTATLSNGGTLCSLDVISTGVYNITRVKNNASPSDPNPDPLYTYYYYSAKSDDNVFEEHEGDNSSDYCKWLFIPKASFDAFVPIADREKDVEDQWTARAITNLPNSNGFYYLYNPASGCFLGKNGANPGVYTDSERAALLYVRHDKGTYSFSYAYQTTYKYVGTTTSAATAATYFVPVEKSTGRFQLNKAGTYFYVNKSGTNPAFATGTTPNEYSRWVFIPQADFEELTPVQTTDWLDKKSELGDGGLFYIYNPASNRFLHRNSMDNKINLTEQSYATLFHVSENSGQYVIIYSKDDGKAYRSVEYDGGALYANNTDVLLYVDTKASPTKTNYYAIRSYRKISNSLTNTYLAAQKTSSTGYGLNTIVHNTNHYAYMTNTYDAVEKDKWNEWLFIPAAQYEAEFATTPGAALAEEAVTPILGKSYFLYNVEAQKFFKYEYLTNEPNDAVLCTIGGTEDAKTISFFHNGSTYYVIAKTYGNTPDSYVLDWSETSEGSKQYYIFHNERQEMGGYVLYDANYYLYADKTYGFVNGVAVKAGQPATLNNKYKWVFVEPPYTLYYSANAMIHEGKGSATVYVNSSSSAASSIEETTGSLLTSVVRTATFTANPETGYQFMGWKTDPDGDFISTETTYSYNLTVTSTDSEHPDNVTLYAFFEKYDAIVYDQNGIAKDSCATLEAAIAAASKGYTIKLMRQIEGSVNITKGVTIDFNGMTIRGEDMNPFVTVAAGSTDTVVFTDNSVAGNGGISLSYATDGNVHSAIRVSGGTLVINGGFYQSGQRYQYSYDNSFVLNQASSGKIRVNGGYFKSYTLHTTSGTIEQRKAFSAATTANLKLYGGYFTNNSDDNVTMYAATDMEVVASGIEVYQYTLANKNDAAAAVATITTATENIGFSSLADAIAYANNHDVDMVIRLAKSHTLTAGNYVIPEKAILIIPYNALHNEPLVACPLVNNARIPTNEDEYRKLTLASGVHIDVYGTIELGGVQYSYGNGAAGTGRPNGQYGHMVMENGSSIILNNGAELRAWGFVTGEGTIDVRRGARVDEMFQVYDFKGGNGTLAMYTSGHKAFPVNQYYIQNVEVPTKYRPGAALYGSMAAVATGMVVKIIGVDYQDPNIEQEAALFKMDNEDDSEDTWVRKSYSVSTDQQVYEINNSAKISNLFLPLSAVTGVQDADFDSKDCILPITNNFKIHLLSGDMYITQDVAFFPGAELEINKLCTGHINQNTTTYFYDSEEWGPYVYNNVYASEIKYRPGGLQYHRNISSAAGLGDAHANIHGTLKVDGKLRTTEHGANIYSTNADAGTVSITDHAVTDFVAERDTLCTWMRQEYHAASQANGFKASATPYYTELAAHPALLTNTNGSLTPTENAGVGISFCYIDNAWRNLEENGCFVKDQFNVWYIKPQAYVAIHQGTSAPTAELDHTYRDHYAGTNKIYILTDDCQWWEVEAVENHPELFHCTHPSNNIYYYWNGAKWAEKKLTVTWNDWDGSLIATYQVKFDTLPQYLGSTPSRAANDYYTYDFAGWNPTPAKIQEDIVYTAQYNATERKYVITFKNTSTGLGEALFEETQYLGMGDTPTPPALTGQFASMLIWDPAVSIVNGNATYSLSFDMGFGPYTVTFVNWNGGDPLQTLTDLNMGDAVAYSGSDPEKAALADEAYSWTGWTDGNGTFYAKTATLPTASADVVYTATFSKTTPTYEVKFYQEDGETQIGSTQNVAHGAMPEVPNYSKEATTEETYTITWSPLVHAATAAQNYTAVVTPKTRQYRVDWKDGNNAIIETKYVDYGATPVYSGITPTKAMGENKAYTFNGTWKLGEASASADFVTVTGDQVYVAQFDEIDRTLEVNNNETPSISQTTNVQEVIIHEGGKLTVGSGATLNTDILTLEASANGSGQLIAAHVNATTANFDFTLNAVAEKWYAFGVPWSVNLNTDPIVEVGGTNRTFVLGRDYDIIVYNGAKRAASGGGYWCWEFVENKDKILTPGQGYMIRFLSDVTTVRFTKEAGAPVIYNGVFNLEENASANNMNAGWNAMANPMPYHAVLEGPATGYIYNPNDDNYSAYDIEDGRFIVGKAVYVQTVAATSVIVNPAGDAFDFVAAAPKRRIEATEKKYMSLRDYYQVAIASTTTEGGHVYVLPEEDKENKYVIGHDLAQFGMSTAIPQIWVNRYNTKLALNTTALYNETAEFPMGVYAPTAGEYTISLNAQPSDEYNVYLTRDGQAIWNLSDGAFTADLKAGIQSNYGLRLTVNKAPQVVTGVDEAVVDAKGEIRKVMINNQVYIIRGEQVYTIDGQLVK